jgi:hypothetical protein
MMLFPAHVWLFGSTLSPPNPSGYAGWTAVIAGGIDGSFSAEVK